MSFSDVDFESIKKSIQTDFEFAKPEKVKKEESKVAKGEDQSKSKSNVDIEDISNKVTEPDSKKQNSKNNVDSNLSYRKLNLGYNQYFLDGFCACLPLLFEDYIPDPDLTKLAAVVREQTWKIYAYPQQSESVLNVLEFDKKLSLNERCWLILALTVAGVPLSDRHHVWIHEKTDVMLSLKELRMMVAMLVLDTHKHELSNLIARERKIAAIEILAKSFVYLIPILNKISAAITRITDNICKFISYHREQGAGVSNDKVEQATIPFDFRFSGMPRLFTKKASDLSEGHEWYVRVLNCLGAIEVDTNIDVTDGVAKSICRQMAFSTPRIAIFNQSEVLELDIIKTERAQIIPTLLHSMRQIGLRTPEQLRYDGLYIQDDNALNTILHHHYHSERNRYEGRRIPEAMFKYNVEIITGNTDCAYVLTMPEKVSTVSWTVGFCDGRIVAARFVKDLPRMPLRKIKQSDDSYDIEFYPPEVTLLALFENLKPVKYSLCSSLLKNGIGLFFFAYGNDSYLPLLQIDPYAFSRVWPLYGLSGIPENLETCGYMAWLLAAIGYVAIATVSEVGARQWYCTLDMRRLAKAIKDKYVKMKTLV